MDLSDDTQWNTDTEDGTGDVSSVTGSYTELDGEETTASESLGHKASQRKNIVNLHGNSERISFCKE